MLASRIPWGTFPSSQHWSNSSWRCLRRQDFLPALMISAGMPSFPGALLLAKEPIALLSSSTVGGVSSSSMTRRDGPVRDCRFPGVEFQLCKIKKKNIARKNISTVSYTLLSLCTLNDVNNWESQKFHFLSWLCIMILQNLRNSNRGETLVSSFWVECKYDLKVWSAKQYGIELKNEIFFKLNFLDDICVCMSI